MFVNASTSAVYIYIYTELANMANNVLYAYDRNLILLSSKQEDRDSIAQRKYLITKQPYYRYMIVTEKHNNEN